MSMVHDNIIHQQGAAISTSLSLALIVFFWAAPAFAQQIFTREPPPGGLALGQIILVDDGRCPKGQIKQVTGGIGAARNNGKEIPRVRKCIKKP